MQDDNHKIPKRSTQKKFGRSHQDAHRTRVANRLQQGIEAIKKEFERRQTIFTQHEQEDIERCIVFDYAKEHNLWIENLYSLGKPTHVGGYENTLALDDTNGFLYKSNNLFNAKFLISTLLEQVQFHNELFPETHYELVGFTGLDNGIDRTPYIEVILKQQYVDNATQATTDEIVRFMQLLDFIQISEAKFTNGEYIVADLFPRNVLKDKSGFIYVVDDIVTRK